MSIKEIIKRLWDDGKYGWPKEMERQGYERDAQALREAIALLRTHPDNQPNEPLTLEELKQMDGKPVWVEEEKRYALVAVDGDRVDITLARHQWGVGNGLTLFRRPPKEV